MVFRRCGARGQFPGHARIARIANVSSRSTVGRALAIQDRAVVVAVRAGRGGLEESTRGRVRPARQAAAAGWRGGSGPGVHRAPARRPESRSYTGAAAGPACGGRDRRWSDSGSGGRRRPVGRNCGLRCEPKHDRGALHTQTGRPISYGSVQDSNRHDWGSASRRRLKAEQIDI